MVKRSIVNIVDPIEWTPDFGNAVKAAAAERRKTLELELRTLIGNWYTDALEQNNDSTAPLRETFDSLVNVALVTSGSGAMTISAHISFKNPSKTLFHLYQRINSELGLE